KLQQKNFKLKVISPDSNSPVTCDKEILLQVVKKLLENAIQFGDEGSEIVLKTESQNSGTYFEVQNTGKPLSPEMIDKILKPFTLDENIMNHSKGIGLGLSICQAFLKLH